MVSFPQVSPPKPCAHISLPPYVPHAPKAFNKLNFRHWNFNVAIVFILLSGNRRIDQKPLWEFLKVVHNIWSYYPCLRIQIICNDSFKSLYQLSFTDTPMIHSFIQSVSKTVTECTSGHFVFPLSPLQLPLSLWFLQWLIFANIQSVSLLETTLRYLVSNCHSFKQSISQSVSQSVVSEPAYSLQSLSATLAAAPLATSCYILGSAGGRTVAHLDY